MKKRFLLVLTCGTLSACAPHASEILPPAPHVDTSWTDEILRKNKESEQLFGKAIADTNIACGSEKYGLPSTNFAKEMNQQAVDEFYGCFESNFPNAARAVDVEARWITSTLQMSSFQESLWRQVIEKSITPGLASQEMVMFEQKQEHDMRLERAAESQNY